MKKELIFICVMSFALSLHAQVQYGIVKTLGRPDKKGTALNGVTLRVYGEHNAVMSGDDGAFSFQLPGKAPGDAYKLQQVRKSGYELNDLGLIGRQLAYSNKVPLSIVMVSSTQLEADKRRIENNAYKVAEKNYKNKLNLLEKQLSEGTVTAEQYRKDLAELQDRFGKYQSLINDLANHYAHTDYDMLSEKERGVNICIENGELERADSLLRLIFNPDDVLERNVAALSRIEQSEREGRRLLEQAGIEMEKVLRQQEKDAEYLYHLFTIAVSRFDNEKARFYIETRAELDTTNVSWQLDAGEFLETYVADYNKAMCYFNRAIVTPNITKKDFIICRIDIGSIIEYQGKYNDALLYNMKTLNLFSNSEYKAFSAILYINIGNEYRYLGDYDNSITNLEKAWTIWKETGEEDFRSAKLKMTKSFYVLSNHLSLAKAYNFSNQNDKALLHLHYAETICDEQDNDMSSSLAGVYSTLGDIYKDKQDYNNALSMHKKALVLYEKIYGENHPFVGITYHNIGDDYSMMDDYDSALAYFNKAIVIKTEIYGESHSSLANSYANIGGIYFYKEEWERAFHYFDRAVNIYKDVYGENHDNTIEIQKIIDFLKSKMHSK